MTKDDAIKAIEAELESALCAPSWSASLAHVHTAIEAIRALPDAGWRDISEAKPIEFIDVVLLSRVGKPNSAMPAFWDGDKWRCLSIVPMLEYQNPTHFMPLPPPPEKA